MNDSIVSNWGKSSMNTPWAELNTSGLREISAMCACLTVDQNPLALFRFGSSESGGPFQLTGSFARSHRNVSWCADRGRAQNSSEFRLVLTPSVAVVMAVPQLSMVSAGEDLGRIDMKVSPHHLRHIA